MVGNLKGSNRLSGFQSLLMNRKIPLSIILFIVTILVMTSFCDKIKFRNKIKELTEVKPHEVITLKMYPGAIRPIGTSNEFSAPDRMIHEFLQSLRDARSYYPNHDTVASQKHRWFLEAITTDNNIQFAFYIPSLKSNIVIGRLGKWDENYATFDGYFQSQNLYHWYQKYSHRWLEPEEEHDTKKEQQK